MNSSPNAPNLTYLKNAMIILVMISSMSSLAQANSLKLTKIKDGKIKRTKLYEEGRRVKITTLNGEKHKGKFTILDEKTLNIDNIDIPLNEIDKIRLSGDGIVAIGAVMVIAGASLSIYSSILLSAEVISFGLLKVANAGTMFLIGNGLNLAGLFFLIDNSPKKKNWKLEIVQHE